MNQINVRWANQFPPTSGGQYEVKLTKEAPWQPMSVDEVKLLTSARSVLWSF